VQAFIMPGNDDPPEIDAVLGQSTTLRNVHGAATELAPGIWMASRGESTPTPWNTPRELSEADLGDRVRDVVALLPEGGTTIWNLHMPPHDSGIDRAPRLDAALNVQYDGSGEPHMVPVGSTSIRKLIADRQPTLALHGHIHEGRGRYRIGSTSGFNPGSQYQDGVLLGLLIRVSSTSGLRHFAFTAG
jgi:Icc-related predicted phosphoesterase